MVENLKAVTKPTKSWSAFCHHHVPVVLSNVSHKLLPIMGQPLPLVHPGKYFLLSWCFRRDREGQLLLKNLPVCDTLGKKKKWCKVLEFQPGLEHFLGKTELCFPWAREEAVSSVGPDSTGGVVCGWQGAVSFTSEKGVAVLGLLGQLRGAPGWTTLGCAAWPSGCSLLVR